MNVQFDLIAVRENPAPRILSGTEDVGVPVALFITLSVFSPWFTPGDFCCSVSQFTDAPFFLLRVSRGPVLDSPFQLPRVRFCSSQLRLPHICFSVETVFVCFRYVFNSLAKRFRGDCRAVWPAPDKPRLCDLTAGVC